MNCTSGSESKKSKVSHIAIFSTTTHKMAKLNQTFDRFRLEKCVLSHTMFVRMMQTETDFIVSFSYCLRSVAACSQSFFLLLFSRTQLSTEFKGWFQVQSIEYAEENINTHAHCTSQLISGNHPILECFSCGR